MLVGPEQIEQYNSSDSAILANKLYAEFEDRGCLLNQSEYVSMRDHLLCLFILAMPKVLVSLHL